LRLFTRIGLSLIVFTTANIYSLFIIRGYVLIAAILLVFFLLINNFPSFYNRKLPTYRLRICADGCELLRIFLITTVLSALYLAGMALWMATPSGLFWAISILTVVLTESIIFWNGILRVYSTSVQLGIKLRLLGALCGWIPVAHLYFLIKIIRTVSAEVAFESEKVWLDNKRKNLQICSTQYPLLLVHGVFFRDYKHLNYWGRIPDELKKNGAIVYYGNHHSASSVEDSGKELSERIQKIVEDMGCGKVNIIAHSKGGLDCRYAINKFGIEKYVASLTTINTPHRGCIFADTLISKSSEKLLNSVARKYNTTVKKLGDSNPDFLAAINSLTASSCLEMNESITDVSGVFYQSVGSQLNRATGGKFPLNLSYPLVKHFDGPNDGLVAVSSFAWGERKTFLMVKSRRGISHGDMIDLNRENLDGFDVREFYVDLVHDLKERGF
jgi:triacylglycerol lipase